MTNKLIQRSRPHKEKVVEQLRHEFDEMFAKMQRSQQRKAVNLLFSASDKKLSELARRLVPGG